MRRMLVGGVLGCLLGLVSLPASAASYRSGDGHEHVAFGETIRVEPGREASDIVCAFCTVELRGDMSGDLVTFFGNVEVGEGRTIGGDAVMFGGRLRLPNEAHVAGDLVFYGGDLAQASTASVHGDRVVLAGAGWLLVALLPFLIPIAIVWGIIRLFRRNRYQFPAYPGGRRF